MSERHKAVFVTLAIDLREEDLEPIAAAIRMVKGVVAVDPLPADPNDFAVRVRALLDARQAILTAIDKLIRPGGRP